MLLVDCVLAVLPIAWLIVALAVLKLPAHGACLGALGLAALLALVCWGMDALCVATAALEGVLNALWPICLVIVAALFMYNLIVHTGAMEQIKRMLAGVSSDVRVLVLLIGWGFGNFMEGMAGFGTAVAIPASMLVAIGVNPLRAVVGCLVVNSTPTAFGSVGVPTATLATVAGVDAVDLSADVVTIQCLLAFVSPFFLVCICGGGVRALKGMVPTAFVAAVAFVLPWCAVAYALGPELPDVAGAVCSMAGVVAAARLFNRAPDPMYALDASGHSRSEGRAHSAASTRLSLREVLCAWSPFIFVFVLLLGTSSLVAPVHDALAGFKTNVQVYAGEGAVALVFSWVNTPGVMIFLAAVAGGLVQGARLHTMAKVLVQTLRQYWRTVVTICAVMAMAKVMSYSGMIASVAAVLVALAGPVYPLVAPFVGVLGAFVTGSGTSTNVLFGGLQAQTALALGLSPSWMAAANVMGAGIGKMICPQGIAIGAGSAGLLGKEREIMAGVLPYCALYAFVAGVACMIGSLLGA